MDNLESFTILVSVPSLATLFARWLAFDSGSFVFAEIMDLTEAEPTNWPNVNKMHHVCELCRWVFFVVKLFLLSVCLPDIKFSHFVNLVKLRNRCILGREGSQPARGANLL